MYDMLEKALTEFEAQSADWRERMEDVRKKAGQVDRKARGLGMWWTREDFKDVDDAAD